MRTKTLVSLILAFLLLASSSTVARGVVAMTLTSARKPDAEATPPSMLDSNASDPPILVGVKINIYPGASSVRYVNSSDYFYVNHGFGQANWSSLTPDVQSAFLDPQQTYFTLQTSAANFQNPPLTHYTDYDSAADVMSTLFFFQFHPDDLAPGTYSFTGTWSSVAAANPPNYTAIHFQNTITLVVLYNSSTLVSCSPNPVSIGSPITCTATVSGSNPTGTVTWSTSSRTGSFSQSVCTLSNGSCSTFYTDNSTGSETITASFSGDSHNSPSSGSASLTVFTNITVGVNVTVQLTSDLELTFSNVTAAGYATTNKTSTVQAPLLVNPVGLYYDIRVMAGYSGNVTVSLAYDDANMTQQQESTLTMMQYTPIPGDVVSYGQVNILDISFIATRFGTTPASPNWNAAADINGDAKIDILDISTCAVNYGKTAEWKNITTYVDTELNIIRGETTHFSIIGIHR